MLSSEVAFVCSERSLASLQSTLRNGAIVHEALASLAVVQLTSGSLAVGATLGLSVWQFWAAGPQRLLLLSLFRLAVLLCVGLVAYKAFGTRSPSFLGIQRPALYRVAIYLQLLWFASELLLGSALLVFLPLLQGSELGQGQTSSPAALFTKVIPICYMVGMAGCLCFFSQLKKGRRGGSTGPFSPSNCGFYADTESVAPAKGGSYLGGGGGSQGGMQMAAQPARAAPPAVTCEIVLMEHQLDTNESVLFVHKKLRPIKTRPESPNYLPLLKPMIQNNNSFGHHHPPQPQHQQPLRQPPPQPQPATVINLSSAAAQLAAVAAAAQQRHGCGSSAGSASGSGCGTGSGGRSSGGQSYTSPIQRLQQLAATHPPHAHQQQRPPPPQQQHVSSSASSFASCAQSISFTSARDASFACPSTQREAVTVVAAKIPPRGDCL